MKKFFAFFILAVATSATAQTNPVRAPKASPSLTEVQQLRLENISLKFQQTQTVLQQAQKNAQDLQEQYAALTADIEKQYPGYTLDQRGNLVAKPTPESKPESKK